MAALNLVMRTSEPLGLIGLREVLFVVRAGSDIIKLYSAQ